MEADQRVALEAQSLAEEAVHEGVPCLPSSRSGVVEQLDGLPGESKGTLDRRRVVPCDPLYHNRTVDEGIR